MIGKIKILATICAILTALPKTFAQNSSEDTKILVVGLDTLQFSSNVFYLDELAYYNNTGEYDVVELYNHMLTRTIRETSEDDFAFVVADSADAALVHSTSVFIETANEYGDEFIGVAPAEGDGGPIIELMKKYDADFILFLNAYQIYHKDPPEYVSYDIKADHIIHFDIFTNQLSSVYGGIVSLSSSAVEAFMMRPHYRKFAINAVKWIRAYKRSLENKKSVKENFELLRDEMYLNASGLSATVGFDGPYGLLGLSFSRFIGRTWEPNIGIGIDFSGFRTGVGVNYYFHNALSNESLKPFIGLNYSFASGNEFEWGGQKDDYGNQLNPDDVSRFKIHAEHLIQLQGGMSYWMNNSAISLSVGYGYPFRDKRPKQLWGKESKARMNLVEAFAPGALGVTVKYMLFINQRFMTMYRFW